MIRRACTRGTLGGYDVSAQGREMGMLLPQVSMKESMKAELGMLMTVVLALASAYWGPKFVSSPGGKSTPTCPGA